MFIHDYLKWKHSIFFFFFNWLLAAALRKYIKEYNVNIELTFYLTVSPEVRVTLCLYNLANYETKLIKN
jgi:hypothetical protein